MILALASQHSGLLNVLLSTLSWLACSELRASKMALSPMTRQVAEAAERQEALRQAHQEAAACKHHLQPLEQAHAAQLHTVDEQRSECLRVSLQDRDCLPSDHCKCYIIEGKHAVEEI